MRRGGSGPPRTGSFVGAMRCGSAPSAASRSLLVIVVAGGALVGLASLAVIKQGRRRDLSVGFYLSGSGLLGAASSRHRGPGAAQGGRRRQLGSSGSSTRGVRWASPEEQNEALNVSALFVSLGLVPDRARCRRGPVA